MKGGREEGRKEEGRDKTNYSFRCTVIDWVVGKSF